MMIRFAIQICRPDRIDRLEFTLGEIVRTSRPRTVAKCQSDKQVLDAEYEVVPPSERVA